MSQNSGCDFDRGTLLGLDDVCVHAAHGCLVIGLFHAELNIHLAHGLVEREYVDPHVRQCSYRTRQHAADLHIGADSRHDPDSASAYFRIWKFRLKVGDDTFSSRQPGVEEVSSGVGVQVLGDDAGAMSMHGADDYGVIPVRPHHVLVEHLDGNDTLASGNDLHTRPGTYVILGDQRAGVLRLERVLHAQRNAHLAQSFCRTGMNCFHAQAGKLVGHVVVGASDSNYLLGSNQARVGATQVELLVDDGFACAADNRQASEGHLAIAAIEGAYHACFALAVTRDDGHFLAQIHLAQSATQAIVERQQGGVAPSCQIDKARRYAVASQKRRHVVGGMHFTNGCEHLAQGGQVFCELEMAVCTDATQVLQAAAYSFNTICDEKVGVASIRCIAKQ